MRQLARVRQRKTAGPAHGFSLMWARPAVFKSVRLNYSAVEGILPSGA
jgi:hypothetical protein